MTVCYPVLETESIRYSVQPGCEFLSPSYYKATVNKKTGLGSVHPGVDINDTRGGDSDLGRRVRAIADGVVVEAADFPIWGGLVLIHHPSLDVYSLSAHLTGIRVAPGDRVSMGDVIGHIGKGAWRWAHLHFELRRSRLPANFWPSAKYPRRAEAEDFVRRHYLDPEAWFAEHGALRDFAAVMAARGEGSAAPPEAPTPPPPPAEPELPVVHYVWAPVRDGITPVPGLWVSIPLSADGRLLVQEDGRPSIVRVPADRLSARGLA